MYIDTSLMRTPFLKIRMGPPMNNKGVTKLVDLPPHVASLLSMFEYNQVIDGGQSSIGQVTLNFVEGSFNDSGTGMGKVGTDNPGSLLDLMLDVNSSEAIRYIKPEEIDKSIKQVEETRAVEEKTLLNSKVYGTSLLDSLQKSADAALQQEQQNSSEAVFLFQERNVVEVTWGYREADGGTEPLLHSNTVVGQIARIIHRAHESDIPTLEIFAIDYGSGEFSKLKPEVGLNFSRGVCAKRLKLTNQQMMDKRSYSGVAANEPGMVDDVVRAVATFIPNCETNIKLTDEERKLDLQQKSSNRTWASGMTLNEFLKDLAEKLYAHYWVSSRIDKETGKLIHVINVVSRIQKESKVTYCFSWKGGEKEQKYPSTVFNTVKSFTLSLFPEGGQGGSSSGVDTENKLMIGDSSPVTVQMVAKDKSEAKLIESTATEIKFDNTVLNGAGKYHESAGVSDHQATSKLYAGRMSRALRLDFITLGIPLFGPSTINMFNIGRRYSGEYYVLSVAHRISASDGYICTVMANTNAIAKGGVTNRDSMVQEPVLPEVEVTLMGSSDTDIESTERAKKGDK